jgi:hypothetical protein
MFVVFNFSDFLIYSVLLFTSRFASVNQISNTAMFAGVL